MFQTLQSSSENDPPPRRAEIDVVASARQGDSAAFARLFQDYNGRICTYLARMVGNDELGRDLAQETLLQLFSEWSMGIQHQRWKSCMARITRNSAQGIKPGTVKHTSRKWRHRRIKKTMQVSLKRPLINV
jgi:RNA polymerase sigma-70 factor, ECF subfamily